MHRLGSVQSCSKTCVLNTQIIQKMISTSQAEVAIRLLCIKTFTFYYSLYKKPGYENRLA